MADHSATKVEELRQYSRWWATLGSTLKIKFEEANLRPVCLSATSLKAKLRDCEIGYTRWCNQRPGSVNRAVNKPNHSTDVESSLSPISTADSSDSDEGAISPTVRTPLPLVKVMDTWLKNYFPMVEQHVLPMLRSNRKRKHERKSSSKSKTRRHKRRDSSSSSSSSTDSKSTSSESSCSSYDFDSDSSEEEVPPPPKRPKVLPQRRQAQSVTHPVQTATMEHSDVPKSDYVMYIFVNSDLKMTAGKVASQVGHIVHVIVDECVRESYETFPPSPLSLTYQSWNSCCTKIILKATEQELKELLNRKDARGFYDSGRTTQGTNDALTAVGLLPGPPQDDLVAPYKLL